MKHLFYILISTMVLVTCQKTDQSIGHAFVGDWKYEVMYQSTDNTQNTTSMFEGRVVNFKDQLTFYFGINDYVSGSVNKEGVVYTEQGDLLGVIEPNTCLLDFSRDGYHIIVEGVKVY